MTQAPYSSTPASRPGTDASASLAADLRSAADRARDERLKLAAMFKQQQANVQLHGGPAPTTQVTALAEKIQNLDQAVAMRLAALTDAESRIDERMAKLEDLRDAISQASRAFSGQVEQAQHFKHHVDAAKQHVRMSAGQIVEDIRIHLQEFEGPIAQRLAALNDLDEQMDKRIARMQQMHKQAGEAVDKHLLGALRAAKEQATTMVEPIKQELEAFLNERAQKMEQAVQDKIAALDIDVEDALRPVTSRFEQIVAQAQARATELADALPGELDARCESHIEQLRETLLQQVAALMQGRDEQALREASERYREEVGARLGTMFDEVEQEAEVFSEKLAERFEESREQAAARFGMVIDELEADYLRRADDLKATMNQHVASVSDKARAQAQFAAAQADASVAEVLDSAVAEIEQAATEKIEGMIGRTRSGIDDLTLGFARHIDQAFEKAVHRIDALKDKATTQIHTIDQHTTQAAARVEQAEQDTQRLAERLAAIDGCIKESAEQARAQLVEIETGTGERLDAVERVAAERLQVIDGTISKNAEQVQSRLVEIEASAGDRLDAVENVTADRLLEIEAAIGERMKTIEAEAAARVSELAELAESSGERVAGAITALTQTARQQAEQAQRELDTRIANLKIAAEQATSPMTTLLAEKLAAFESLSIQAREEAQQSIRGELAELHSASKAMVEVVNSQLKKHIAAIEPETKAAIQQAEQTLRDRVSQMRDNAQSMVDLTARRLEQQLEDIKRNAQRSAFQGVDTPTNDAA